MDKKEIKGTREVMYAAAVVTILAGIITSAFLIWDHFSKVEKSAVSSKPPQVIINEMITNIDNNTDKNNGNQKGSKDNLIRPPVNLFENLSYKTFPAEQRIFIDEIKTSFFITIKEIEGSQFSNISISPVGFQAKSNIAALIKYAIHFDSKVGKLVFYIDHIDYKNKVLYATISPDKASE
ncbi:hypothetical protein [Aliikangiella sp. IMCC44359]|uniref:hypothetical protein n=1 Tax=Aliikangiella sp. IMCC44359 TaxID=3459125 RepID=UPI00403AD9FB